MCVIHFVMLFVKWASLPATNKLAYLHQQVSLPATNKLAYLPPTSYPTCHQQASLPATYKLAYLLPTS